MPALSPCTLKRWKNHLSVIKYRQIYSCQAAEPVARDPSAFDAEMAIEKKKGCKSPGIDQIPSELIQAGGRAMRSDVHTRINSTWNKGQLPHQWKEPIIVAAYYKGVKAE